MPKYYHWGPVICEFQDFFSDSFWSLWPWKLDAYEIPYEEGHNVFLSIEKSDASLDVRNLNCLIDEPSGFFSRQVFCDDHGDMIWRLIWRNNQEPVMVFKVSCDWKKITILEDMTDTAGQATFEYMSRMVLYSMILQKVITFHGVLMEYNGNGIILSAPSGTGKTTHARLWRDYLGALIINGDNACCFKKAGQWTGFGIPWCGTSGENINREVPLKAIVVLQQGTENQVRRLSGYEAFSEVLPMLHCPVWHQEIAGLALDGMDEILRDIPVYLLVCRPDQDSVETLKKALEV